MSSVKGRIVKGIGGFYYVKPVDSSVLIETKPRGKFRHQKIKPTVGDYVDVVFNGEECAIEKIYPRKNVFVRPPVANVEVALVVFSAVDPLPDLKLLDKLLVIAEFHDAEPVIVITKIDLCNESELENIRKVYEKTPYPMFFLNNFEAESLCALEEKLAGKTAFLAGPSGVGKSTLANRLCEGIEMETGNISRKLSRGKHTTRHVELLEMNCGGYLFDTPGFSSLSLSYEEDIKSEDLALYFPEFVHGECKFNTCTHRMEPHCAVKEQLENDEISKERYENYVQMYNDLEKREKTW